MGGGKIGCRIGLDVNRAGQLGAIRSLCKRIAEWAAFRMLASPFLSQARLARLLAVAVVSLIATITSAPAQQKVHTTYLWHNHQPIYWNDQQAAGDDQYEDANDSIVAKAGGRAYPLNDLDEIFGKPDRVAAYQYRPRDSVSAMGNTRSGATLNMSGALMENVASLAAANRFGYTGSWDDPVIEANGWMTNPGNKPRLALTNFTYHHALTGYHDQKTIEMEIALHREKMRQVWGQAALTRSVGFFPTEMTFSERLIPTLNKFGIQWAVVSGEKIARACPDFPLVFGSGGVNCDPPNKADQINPAGVNWVRKTISRGCSPVQAVPLSYTPAFATFTDPATETTTQVIVVPSDQSNSWIDGYQCFGTGELSAINSFSNAARPSLVVLAHDGDNAFGGGFSYYQECVPNFVSAAPGAGIQPTTIDLYLAEYPVLASNIVHVEDGGWVFADSDFGSPTFINWNYPPLSASGQIDPVNGWHEKVRDMAVFTATLNRVLTAEQIDRVTNAREPRIDHILDPSGTTTAVERAWHYYLSSLDSGNVYFGAPLDLEVKATLGCNEALQHANPIISAAGASGDTIAPTILLPMRHPYNPGAINYGVQYGYQQRMMGPEFTVYTYIGEVSENVTAVLKYRADVDGTNPKSSTANEIYRQTAEVGAWIDVPMNRHDMPLGDPYNKPEIDYFELPTSIADHFSGQVPGVANTLYDYYVEATDTRGNVARSPIQHVWVGNGTGTGGGGDRVVVTPNPPERGANVTIAYEDEGGPIAGAATVKIHKGINDWATVDSPDADMTFNAGTGKWTITYAVPSTATQIDFVFNNGSNVWDNNSGADWHITTTGGGGPSGPGIVSLSPSTPVRGQPVTVSYENEGGVLTNASQVFIRRGINDFATTEPDTLMTFDAGAGVWRYTYTIPANATTVDYRFTDGASAVDDNNGNDFSYATSGGTGGSSGIVIGAGPELGTTAGATWFEEFQDWEEDTCLILDEPNDTFIFNPDDNRAGSRDLIAFYHKDEPSNGAVFFRADYLELSFQAESASTDLYVVMDFGNPAVGQEFLPDFTDCKTDMRWEVTIALYSAEFWSIYDTNFGVLSSHASNPSRFKGAYYRSDLDAVEFGIDRTLLTQNGWDGTSPINFQVFTTRDLTNGGPGEIADHSDLTDSIVDDDRGYSDSVGGVGTLNGFFRSTDRARGVYYSYVLHGNQAISQADYLQQLIYSNVVQTPNGHPTGFHRALDTARIFDAAPNVHVSGSLVSGSLWADKPGDSDPSDGPNFVADIKQLVDGSDVRGKGALIGGAYSEHIMPYFEGAINRDSIDLNEELLENVFGVSQPQSNSLFWIPERVVKGTTFADLTAAGYNFTVLDQISHLKLWFGATAANAQGYKINRINGVNCFMINDPVDLFKFANSDGGLWFDTRVTILNKAMEADGEQVMLAFDDWEAYAGRSFTSFEQGSDNPDNWNRTIRWIKNHPWIKVRTLEDIAALGWTPVDRGTNTSLPVETYDFLDHATEGNYDNWYFGSSLEEDFDGYAPYIRLDLGTRANKSFGSQMVGGTIAGDLRVGLMSLPSNPIAKLARFGYATGIFETAWHNEDQTNRCPDGTYDCYDDTSFDNIAGFAKQLQFGALRKTGIAISAAHWAANPPSQASAATAQALDVDHDGELEYVLFNNRMYAVFENDGGRLTHLYGRFSNGSYAGQLIGNPLGFPDFEDEQEGTASTRLRTSGLVDVDASNGINYTNRIYTVVSLGNGFQFTSNDGTIVKTATLDAGSNRLQVGYAISGITSLTMKTGLVGDLLTLLSEPGYTAVADQSTAGVYALTNSVTRLGIALDYGANGNTGGAFNASGENTGGNGARNQAMTHVVQLSCGSSGMTFDFVVANDPPASTHQPGVVVR